MRCIKAMSFSLALITVFCAGAYADSITPTGTATFDTGTGVGSVLSVLSLQPGGNVTSEWGGVSWNGTTNVRTGDALNGAQRVTRTVQELLDVGATAADWSVIFNVNQVGGSDAIYLPTFTLTFWTAGGSFLGSLPYTDPPPLMPYTVDGQGQGSSGYVFNVSLTTPGLASVFDNPTNRIGIYIPQGNPITGSNDGPEHFYFGPGPGNILPPVPEPATVILLGTGLLAILGYSRVLGGKR